MGKKKSAKLTDEERLLLEEQKRLADEEMKKKKEDLLTQFLKDKLSKEEKSSKFNLNKLNHQWRNIMREVKSKELKKDIESLSQTFERVVDRKDAVIKSLAKDLMEAEEQYGMAFRSHLENVDKLIALEKEEIITLEDEYQEELAIVKEEFEAERTTVINLHQQEMNEISDILYAMEHNFNEKEVESKSDFQSTRDEIKNKNLEDKHALRVVLESKVDDLWHQFKIALQNYTETTEERKIAFEALKLRDENSSREIETQMRKLQRLSDQIAQVKSKMAANAKENETRNKQLKEERERMQALFQDLKAQMNQLHEKERVKLKKLTLESNASIKELKRQKEKMQLVLKQAEMCRRLETEEEKVLPFYVSSLTKSEQDDIQEAVMEEPVEPLASMMHQYTPLENFWKRYNKVQLDKVAMDREKQSLMHENQQLRLLLKQYLDGISVNDEIIGQINPLFIVNNKTNIKMNGPIDSSSDKYNVIEAAHIVQYTLP